MTRLEIVYPDSSLLIEFILIFTFTWVRFFWATFPAHEHTFCLESNPNKIPNSLDIIISKRFDEKTAFLLMLSDNVVCFVHGFPYFCLIFKCNKIQN